MTKATRLVPIKRTTSHVCVVFGARKMKYRYNIKHKNKNNKVETINFKNKTSMLKYLDKNKHKVNQLMSPALNFGQIMLPLKHTVWHIDS